MSDTSFTHPDIMQTATGDFTLQRRPAVTNRPLRAWDAADEYLLHAAPSAATQPATLLIINDVFGALSVALHAQNPHNWGDSETARLALRDNLRLNHLPETVSFTPATGTPPGPYYATVLWRIPKSNTFFRQQAALLHRVIGPETLVLAAGMVKHLPGDAKDTLNTLGTVMVGPVEKKALLLRVSPNRDLPPPPLPSENVRSLAEHGLQIASLPNVFAHEKLDSGAELFLRQFDRLPATRRIADLGCGNGILGLAAQARQPESEVHFFDESYQAIACAEANYRRNAFASPEEDLSARFHCDDGMSNYGGEPFDLILCNPPFHQQHTVGDQVAWQMFTQSRRYLRPGGELWVVGNRHLNYHVKLQRALGICHQVAADPKFVVLKASKR